jgi:hypothetical protein
MIQVYDKIFQIKFLSNSNFLKIKKDHIFIYKSTVHESKKVIAIKTVHFFFKKVRSDQSKLLSRRERVRRWQ